MSQHVHWKTTWQFVIDAKIKQLIKTGNFAGLGVILKEIFKTWRVRNPSFTRLLPACMNLAQYSRLPSWYCFNRKSRRVSYVSCSSKDSLTMSDLACGVNFGIRSLAFRSSGTSNFSNTFSTILNQEGNSPTSLGMDVKAYWTAWPYHLVLFTSDSSRWSRTACLCSLAMASCSLCICCACAISCWTIMFCSQMNSCCSSLVCSSSISCCLCSISCCLCL